jgi:membrane-associated protease RseP (regulator of RpoE activity)
VPSVAETDKYQTFWNHQPSRAFNRQIFPEDLSLMKFRLAFCVLVSLLLTSGVAMAQPGTSPPQTPAAPGTPVAPQAPGDLQQAFSFFTGGSFIGIHAEDINNENMGSYGLREVRGVGITEVVKDSPAEKAGLRKGDVILRFDDENVSSARKLTRLVSEVAPDHTVRLTISRGGSDQQVAVTVGKRPGFSMPRATIRSFPSIEGVPSGDFVFSLGHTRRIGISTTQLTEQLAEYFGVADGKGVLVTAVTEGGPAAKAGLRAGDVITAVEGEKVGRAGDLTRALTKKKEGDVTLTVIRNKSQMNITVSPTTVEPLLRPGATGQSARRVVIPSIQVPVIPEINISVPRIDLGVTPEIDVVIPSPKVNVKRLPSQPI